MTADEPQPYVAERIRDALAHDDRVAELGISVEVSDEQVELTGDVATPGRKEAVAAVVEPLLDGRELHNDVTVAAPTEPDGREAIPSP